MTKEQLSQIRQAQEYIRQANRILLGLTNARDLPKEYHIPLGLAESITFDLLVDNLNKVIRDIEHEGITD